jgi:predicted transcriptional regulator of viral defense system
MNASDALARLRRLGVPAIETADAAAALGQSTFAASKTLSRLGESGLITPVRKGMWWVESPLDPYRLAAHLTAPLPSYVSLQTALHLRGMIEQIPTIVYVVSLARTESIVTSAGTFSVHHVAPQVFGGFDETAEGVRMATAEKALFDLAYLAGGRSRLFASLPELEVGRGFRWKELKRWRDRIPSDRRRLLVTRRLARFLSKADVAAPLPAWLDESGQARVARQAR